MLPTDAKDRKNIPLYSGLIKYFPDALAAVAEVSRVGNQQHNPGSKLHWDRSKSTDELDALTRHLAEAGGIDKDGLSHSAKIAWRALANLQKEIEGNAALKIGGAQWIVQFIEQHPSGVMKTICIRGPFTNFIDARKFARFNPDKLPGTASTYLLKLPRRTPCSKLKSKN
jgi:hypothetical protein